MRILGKLLVQILVIIGTLTVPNESGNNNFYSCVHGYIHAYTYTYIHIYTRVRVRLIYTYIHT